MPHAQSPSQGPHRHAKISQCLAWQRARRESIPQAGGGNASHAISADTLADTAADFKARFKLSLADAFAAVLAKERRADLVTGDLEFKPLEKEIKVQWLK